METRKFLSSTSEAVYYGWSTVKDSWMFFVGVTLVAAIISGLIGGLAEKMPNTKAFLLVLNQIVSIFIQMGLLRIFLNAVSGDKEPEITDFFADVGLFINYLIATVLFALIVIIGMMLLVVPGIIFGIKYGFYGYFILDQELGPVEALKASAQLTDGIKWDLLGFLFVLTCINIIGLLALGVGMLLTVPLSGIAFAYVYRNLNMPQETVVFSAPEGGPPEPPPEERPVGPVLNARKR